MSCFALFRRLCVEFARTIEEEEDAEDDEELPQDYTVIYFWEVRRVLFPPLL